jgi:hypothetical protein
MRPQFFTQQGNLQRRNTMIEILTGLPDDVLGFSANGKVTGQDYESVLIPAVEEKLEKHKKISLLYHLGADFSGFEAEAMWDDMKVGLHHITAWKKIAVVSDVGWVRSATKAMGFVMPAQVKVFTNEQLDEAREWIGE